MIFSKFNFLIKDFCYKDNTRPEVSGVFVRESETVATDTVSMIRVSKPNADPSEYPEMPQGKKVVKGFNPFILPKRGADSVLKLFGNENNSTLPILDNACIINRNKKEGTVEIGKTNLEIVNSVSTKVAEGRFPDYAPLFLEKGKYATMSINPKLLMRIAKFYSNFVDDNNGIIIKVPLDEGAMHFSGKNKKTGQEAKALLMGIKV